LALGDRQRRPQRVLQTQLLLHPRMALWEGAEHLQASSQVADGLEVGRALEGALPRPLPVGDRWCKETCLRIVMRQQFWLSFNRLRKLGFEHLGNPLVILLPRAF
jgi:hypothetical protein